MKRPKVLTRCVANQYATPNERIIEFTSKNGGGLISFATLLDGRLSCSQGTRVSASSERSPPCQ